MPYDTLKTKKEFDFVYKNSYKFRSEFFDICILKKNLMKHFYQRFKKTTEINFAGFSVSKKVGKAVERNLIKRRLRVILRNLLKRHFGANHQKIIFIVIVKEKIKTIAFFQLEKNIHKALIIK